MKRLVLASLAGRLTLALLLVGGLPLAAHANEPAKKQVVRPAPAGAAAVVAAKIDINSATVEELQSLKGIGPKKAEAIRQHIAENGPFASVDALTEVKGIGAKTLEKLRPHIVAIPPPAAKKKGK